MTYLRTNNRYEQRRGRTIIFFVGILILIFAGVQFFMPHFLPGFYMSLANPFWRAQFSIASGSLSPTATLLNENERLKRELEEIRLQSATVESVINENNELRALLGRGISTSTEEISHNRILSAVLKRPPLALYDELIIDGGKDLGFEVGDKVYATGDILIGKIAEVLSNSSKVTLYSSPGQRVEVMIGPTHAPAFASGKGGGQYYAELPRIVTINEGDEVIAPSLGDKSFGIVQKILSDPAQPFETVLFAPPVNIYEIRWVTVSKS